MLSISSLSNRYIFWKIIYLNNKGDCGSCYAVAALSMLESRLAI